MKTLLSALMIFGFLSTTAWACESMPMEYRAVCYDAVRAAQQRQAQADWSAYVDANVRQYQAQQELARQQAVGLAAFGSGNALVNGMNQGVHTMQVHPYVLPPPQPMTVR